MRTPQSLGRRRGVQKGKVGVLVWNNCLKMIFRRTGISGSTQLISEKKKKRKKENQLTGHLISSYQSDLYRLNKS